MKKITQRTCANKSVAKEEAGKCKSLSFRLGMKTCDVFKYVCLATIITAILCAWIPFINKPDYEFTFLSYNAKDHTLRISNASSGAYISKVELDLHKDTLSVKVYKRLIFIKPTSIINSSITDWRIKLKSNIGFVRFGNTVKSLSELRTYPVEGAIYYQTIEVFPQKYPYVGK